MAGEKKENIKDKAVNTIKVKCTDKVLRYANIISIVLLIIWAILRILWIFGAFSPSTATTTTANPTVIPQPTPAPPPTRRL